MIFLNDRLTAHLGDAAVNNTAFFNQQLTHIVARLFMVKYKEIKFRDAFRINNEGGAGVTSVQLNVWDMGGSAKIIGHYSDDLPSSGAGATQVTVPIRWIGDSFHWSWMEIEQAAYAGVGLKDMRAMAANKAIEIKLNNIAFGVDEEATDAGIYGLMNNPNVPDAPVVDGASGETEWETKTPNEILLDINNAFSTVSVTTDGVHQPNMLSMPIKQWNLLATTRISDLVETTLLQFIVKQSPWISSMEQIKKQPELAGAGPNGEDIFYVYQDDDEVAEFYIPYEKNTPVGTLVDGIAYKTPMICSTGGLDIRYPLAYYKGVGI